VSTHHSPATAASSVVRDPGTYGLAIHTSSSDFGLAISNFSRDRRVQTWALGRDLSMYLHTYLVDFLQPQTWSDLAFIAVAKGPGGFTGTRLGVVTARTLAQQLEIPLFGISSLAAIAYAESLKGVNDAIAIQMKAQRGEVFGAIYQPTATGLATRLEDTVLPLEQWQQQLNAWSEPLKLVVVEAEVGSTVESLLALAYLKWQLGDRPHWSDTLPFYGQHPVDR